MAIKQYDIVVVGAGIVGLTCALALANSPLKIAVVDAAKGKIAPSGAPLPRVSAVSIASKQVFERVGVWHMLDHARMQAYDAMHVWEQDSFAEIDFSAQQVQQDALGYIIENDHIIAQMQSKAADIQNIDLLLGSKIQELTLSKDTQALQLDNQDMVLAKLVVGADGGNSLVRRVAGYPQTFWSYNQNALVTTVETEIAHNNTARQVFTEFGPLALLPLWQPNLCSIVWSQDTEMAEQLDKLAPAEFDKRLTAAFDVKLGRLTSVDKLHSFPLTMQYARQWVGDGAVIIGDAAHTIHPLAGQGANLGIMDAAALAETLIDSMENDTLIDPRLLRKFERWRKSESAKMTATMELFKQLFAGKHPAKKLLRGVGMSITNKVMPAKKEIILQAMGVAGELPNLAGSSSAK